MTRRYSAHLGYMFNEYSLDERFAVAARSGFNHVEHPGTYALPAERVRDLCVEFGLTFVQMALPAGDLSRGEKGLAALPGRQAAFRESVGIGFEYALTLGCRYVHVMSGVVPDPSQQVPAWTTYVANLGFTCGEAAKFGLTVLIEPIGAATIPNYLIDHPQKALRIIEEVGAPNLQLLFDAFHATNAGVDAASFVSQHARGIAHVHIADHPGRHEPGTGQFEFTRFFSALDAVGYSGVVGLEYIPADITIDGLKWRTNF